MVSRVPTSVIRVHVRKQDVREGLCNHHDAENTLAQESKSARLCWCHILETTVLDTMLSITNKSQLTSDYSHKDKEYLYFIQYEYLTGQLHK